MIVLLEISKTCPEIANGFPSWAGQGEGEEDKWGGGGVKARNKVKFQPKVHLFRGEVGRRVSKTVNRREKNLGF